jgi:hypothetical protein
MSTRADQRRPFNEPTDPVAVILPHRVETVLISTARRQKSVQPNGATNFGTASAGNDFHRSLIMKTGKYVGALIAVCLVVTPSLVFARGGGAHARAFAGAIFAPTTVPSLGSTTIGMNPGMKPSLGNEPGVPNTTTPGLIGTMPH